MAKSDKDRAGERLTWTDEQLKIVKKGEPAKKVTQSFVTLRSRGIQALMGVDVLALVPEDVLARIRERDPHPFLQAYSICHEGLSTPTLLGDTAKPIHWTRAAVQSIRRTVLRGVKFFLGHNEDNSTEGRESLGEIVWDGQKEIDGVLHHVVVGYFPDRGAVEDKDVCSQEAEWSFVEQAGRWFADKLERLTGIALSSSSEDEPAFSGARRLGMVQAFDEDEQESADEGRRRLKERKHMEDITTVSFDDLASELKRRGAFPSRLFTVEDLRRDNVFVKIFTDGEAASGKVKEQELELKKLRDDTKMKDRALASTTAKERFEKAIDAMTLTPKQRAYVKASLPVELEDASDEALKKIIDVKLKDFKVAAKAFDVKEELPTQGANGEQKRADADDLTKAENNELLEADMEL